ncbi:MAG: hypothetical protein ABIH37_04195 [archaeon]
MKQEGLTDVLEKVDRQIDRAFLKGKPKEYILPIAGAVVSAGLMFAGYKTDNPVLFFTGIALTPVVITSFGYLGTISISRYLGRKKK